MWDSPALAAATHGHATADFAIAGLSIDTRTLVPGDLFIALVGERDGHEHTAAALAKGAAAVMVHRADSVPAGAPALLVDDTLAALQRLGAAGRA
ncbi:MAG: UDP-N-acetylmuramoyl-tripeptide--D-alanyl-D-alanine ligase, partial [Oxalobacteraceae bacterium]